MVKILKLTRYCLYPTLFFICLIIMGSVCCLSGTRGADKSRDGAV